MALGVGGDQMRRGACHGPWPGCRARSLRHCRPRRRSRCTRVPAAGMKPLDSAVDPLASASRSSSTQSTPASRSISAAVRPQAPAPTMATGVWGGRGGHQLAAHDARHVHRQPLFVRRARQQRGHRVATQHLAPRCAGRPARCRASAASKAAQPSAQHADAVLAHMRIAHRAGDAAVGDDAARPPAARCRHGAAPSRAGCRRRPNRPPCPPPRRPEVATHRRPRGRGCRAGNRRGAGTGASVCSCGDDHRLAVTHSGHSVKRLASTMPPARFSACASGARRAGSARAASLTMPPRA